MNKTKYWDLYREMYAELGNDDATFRRLFGDEFAQAYEEQMQRLTTLRSQR
jgi:type VI secretion system protein ImpI